jgi:hypothetical protein
MAKRLNWTVLMDDTNYLCAAKMPSGAFVFVEVTDMDDACGRDNEEKPPFVMEVSLVDLSVIDEETLRSALDSCGWEGMEDEDGNLSDLVRAEACFQHGNKAPMHSADGGAFKGLIAEGKREATLLANSDRELAKRMGRTVNRMGSTAAEYMRGDLMPGMVRGVEKGDIGARIMARLEGIDPNAIDRASDMRPADYLPYVMGYMDAMSDSKKEIRKVSPEYHQGYDRGVAVKAGTAVPPSWIKTGSGKPVTATVGS